MKYKLLYRLVLLKFSLLMCKLNHLTFTPDLIYGSPTNEGWSLARLHYPPFWPKVFIEGATGILFMKTRRMSPTISFPVAARAPN
jgi:hypothetical protein